MLNGITALRPARGAHIKCGSRALMKFTKNIGPHWPAALIFLIPAQSLTVVMKPGRYDMKTWKVAELKEARVARYVNCCRKISTFCQESVLYSALASKTAKLAVKPMNWFALVTHSISSPIRNAVSRMSTNSEKSFAGCRQMHFAKFYKKTDPEEVTRIKIAGSMALPAIFVRFALRGAVSLRHMSAGITGAFRVYRLTAYRYHRSPGALTRVGQTQEYLQHTERPFRNQVPIVDVKPVASILYGHVGIFGFLF